VTAAFGGALAFITFAVVSLLVYPPTDVANFLDVMTMPLQYRVFLCVLALLNASVVILLELGVLSICRGTTGTGKARPKKRKRRSRRYRPMPLPVVMADHDDGDDGGGRGDDLGIRSGGKDLADDDDDGDDDYDTIRTHGVPSSSTTSSGTSYYSTILVS